MDLNTYICSTINNQYNTMKKLKIMMIALIMCLSFSCKKETLSNSNTVNTNTGTNCNSAQCTINYIVEIK